jgi:Tol biopolymer transport system component/DNA-binding winged helix-turn-helix (wHTH) protein
LPSQYRFDDVEIDLTSYRVLKAGRVLSLEPKTFSVLIFLVRNPGRLVEKRELLDAVWNDAFVTENVLTRAIAQLRKALGDGVKEGRYIETVPTQGYRFIADVQEYDPVEKPPAVQASRSHAALWVGIVALVILATGIAVWRLRPKVADRPMSLPVPLTTFQGSETQPSFSPDGNQVAFSWDSEKADNWDIYVKVLGSETPLRLTTDPAEDISPAWSPDGRTIAFVRLKDLGRFDLMLIPALGGPERKLAEFGYPTVGTTRGRGVVPTWSADSKWLVVPLDLTDVNEMPLFKVSVETGEAIRITQPDAPLADTFPQISPNGDAILFTRRRRLETGDLYTMALDGNANPVGQPHQIPLGGLRVGETVWSADGQEIQLLTMEGAYRTSAKGSESPERIAWLSADVASVAVSRSGNRLAYSVVRGDANIWRIDLTAQAPHPERLIASTFRDIYPQYSPDGKRIAFYSYRSGSGQIWMGNADGGQPHQLTFVESGVAGTPHWSPDGKTLALDSSVSGAFQVYTMSTDGGKMTQMTQGPSSNFGATWTRDGRWIYFCSSRTGRSEVWKMPLAGGAPVQVTRGGGGKAVESFDGQTIYFSKDSSDGSIWKIPAEGGPETQLVASLYRFNFALAKQGIYYMTARGEDGTSALKFYSFSSGNAVTVAQIGRPEYGLDVSPDGRYLTYAQLDDAGSNLMLVENFH